LHRKGRGPWDDPTQQQQFFWSNGVDLNFPFQLRLAKDMPQVGYQVGGGTPVTHEGSTFSDYVGNSTIVGDGTDRLMHNPGDAIQKTVGTIGAAGSKYQVDWYAYI